jgi:hypothetical protein
MDILDKFLNHISYKFPKGYPDINDINDMKLLENILESMGINLDEPDTPLSKYGYKIGEFTTPSETLASRSWNFNSRVGYLGTGYYFYGDEETAKADRKFLNREKTNIKQFPLSDYKLYRANDPEKFYDEIKNITRELGLFASSGEEISEDELNEALQEIVTIIKNELNIPLSEEQIIEILKSFITDIREKNDGVLLSNRLLSPLGFEGIDNTNTPLDNYGVGSVIFTK